MFQIPGRRADSLRIGRYTNFLDTTASFRCVHSNGSYDYYSATNIYCVFPAFCF